MNIKQSTTRNLRREQAAETRERLLKSVKVLFTEKGEIRDMDFEIAAKQFMSISVMNIVSKLIKIELVGEMLEEVYRKKIIQYTLNLWKKP
jgi:tRNA U38,U39,U40 pseudouridine synthase TruA